MSVLISAHALVKQYLINKLNEDLAKIKAHDLLVVGISDDFEHVRIRHIHGGYEGFCETYLLLKEEHNGEDSSSGSTEGSGTKG